MAKKRYIEDNIRTGNKKKAFLIILAISLTSIGVIFGLSYEIVDYNEYALLQNDITREIDTTTVYEEGLHLIGILSSFIRFPSTWQTIEFSPSADANDIAITANTQDGFQVQVDTSFQYRLNKSQLLELYGEFGADYEQFYVQTARSTIRNVVSRYNATEFYTNRESVNNALKEGLQNQSAIFRAEVGEFQLRQVDLPDNIETQLQNIFILQLDIQQALLEQDAAKIRFDTLIFEAEAQYNITILNAEAAALALNITITAEGLALFELAASTGFNTTELLNYLWIKAIENLDPTYLIIGPDTPLLFQI